jgi:hypothetical protein
MNDPFDDSRFVAGTVMIGRMGATNFQVRFCEEEEPTVWIVSARWERNNKERWEAAGALDPGTAMYRFLELVMDGGACLHCGKVTSIDDLPATTPMDTVMDKMFCIYRYDPELRTYRRSCEGLKP